MKSIFLRKIIITHALVSLSLIILLRTIIVPLWYPSDFYEISASNKIFLILVYVEILLFLGLILLLFFGRNNSKKEILIVYIISLTLQLSAVLIGTKTLYEAKPMYVVYEFDRFRIVRPIDMFWGQESKKYNFASGPEFYSVEKYQSNDIRLLKSIKDSVNGFYPSFKKERLIPYEGSKIDIINNSKKLTTLSPDKQSKVIKKMNEINIDILGYYPLVSNLSDEWIILIDLNNAKVLGYINISGWST